MFPPTYHFGQLCSPTRVALCLFGPIITHTLCHCLFQSPDPKTPTMTLCAQLLFQIARPNHVFCSASRAICLHHEKILGKVCFIAVHDLVLRPVVSQQPCPSGHVRFRAFLRASWVIDNFAQHVVLYRSQMCALSSSHQCIDDKTQEISDLNLKISAISLLHSICRSEENRIHAATSLSAISSVKWPSNVIHTPSALKPLHAFFVLLLSPSLQCCKAECHAPSCTKLPHSNQCLIPLVSVIHTILSPSSL